MKKLWVILLVAAVAVMGFGAKKSYDEFSPAKRMSIASDWLETGKAFQKNNKNRQAKASFTYAIEVYPMGKDAAEARQILKNQFDTDMPYNAESVFRSFMAKGDSLPNGKPKLNNYLMALEVRDDKTANHKAALVYLRIGDRANAAEYLRRAIAGGLTEGEINPALKDLQ